MNNGRLDRALMLAIFVALGGLYWQMFSMNERISNDNARLSSDIAEVSARQSADMAEVSARQSADMAELSTRLSGEIAELSERLARIETLLEYIVPCAVGPASEQSPDG